MLPKPLLLRCKCKVGQSDVKTLTSENTAHDLLSIISSFSGIPQNRLSIRLGFPPRPLRISNLSATLESLKISSGETLIVEEDTSAPEFPERPPFPNTEVPDTFPAQQLSGILMKRVVPSDNSCLFTSIYFVVSGGEYDLGQSLALRKVIARYISSDRETYNDGLLGRSNHDYCKWISSPEAWGGAIELSILSKHFGLEIAVVDTQNERLNRFGEDLCYPTRVFILYDGIHYDPLMLESVDGSGKPLTVFQADDAQVIQMAMEIAVEAKASRQFTDLQGFTLKCEVCGVKLRGQQEAQKHAMETSHVRFGEV